MKRHDFDGPARGSAAKPAHRYAWLWEPLEEDATFELKPMFGSKAVRLDGKQYFCFFAKTEPWRGVLVCTDRASHGSLRAEFPALEPHAVLAKWLYLPEAAEEFEGVAQRRATLAWRRDPRLGVEGSVRQRRRPAA